MPQGSRYQIFTSLLLGSLMFISVPLQASTWNEPHPWRRQALIEGRDFLYNSEAFLHRFSYRNLSQQPAAGEDGIRGSVGSVTGDELVVDIQLQKTLMFDDQRHGVFVRLQRFEDFDGEFDRQIVGVARRLGEHWRIALAGDVKGNKAETDIQLELQYQPHARRLVRLALIAPEYYYNSKSDRDGRYRDRPLTAFLHYREARDDGWQWEVALNASPEARFDDRNLGIDASGDQYRLMAEVSAPLGEWRAGLRLEAERADREFRFEQNAPAADDFRRRMHAVTISASAPHWRFQPEVGARYFRLEEDGWFGTARGLSGQVRRDETLLFASLTIDTSARQQWQPTLYFGPAQARSQWVEEPWRNRDHDRWIGKLALPWRYLVDAERGAQLTINPTIRLHRAAFGGGNIQLHWPF